MGLDAMCDRIGACLAAICNPCICCCNRLCPFNPSPFYPAPFNPPQRHPGPAATVVAGDIPHTAINEPLRQRLRLHEPGASARSVFFRNISRHSTAVAIAGNVTFRCAPITHDQPRRGFGVLPPPRGLTISASQLNSRGTTRLVVNLVTPYGDEPGVFGEKRGCGIRVNHDYEKGVCQHTPHGVAASPKTDPTKQRTRELLLQRRNEQIVYRFEKMPPSILFYVSETLGGLAESQGTDYAPPEQPEDGDIGLTGREGGL